MIAIINFGLGNLRSIAGAIEKLGHRAVITNNFSEIRSAEKLILPGVGAFGDGMKNIKALGLDELLHEEVVEKQKFVLGICLGFQLMAKESHEFGHHEGLGWIDGVVKQLPFVPGLRLPHVGWNDVVQLQNHFIFNNIPDDALYYFVHNYHVEMNDTTVIGTCDYGRTFAAVVAQKNIIGTQFHPEKSQFWGLKLLENFLEVVCDG